MNAAYSQLLLQVARDRCASRSLTRISGLVLLVGVAALVFARYIERPQLGLGMLVGALSFVMMSWGGAMLKSAVQQNQPANACLVPKLRHRLIVLTLMLYGAMTLLIAAMIGAVFGHFGYALVGAGLFYSFILYAQRYPVLAIMPSLVIVLSVSVLSAPLHALWDAIGWMGEPALSGIGLIAASVLGGFGMRAAFPRGGDSHWSWHARRAAALRRAQGDAPKPGDTANWSRWTMPMRIGYRAGLRRDSRGGAAPGRMLAHTFGPAAHEGGYHVAALLILLVLLVLRGFGDSELLRQMVRTSLLQASVLVSVVIYAAELQKSVVRHGAEQALYLLTPGAPAGAQLNRVLGAALLKRFLRVWLVTVACAATIDMVMRGAPHLYASTCVLSALMLPLACTLLRDYAKMPASTNQTAILIATFLAIFAYLMMLGVERTWPAFPVFWVCAAIVLASVLALRWRWRRFTALPAVLPAGRLLE
ncbi:hypothetical protein LPN04_05075 [Rugamonas sp. A1-17]|nr:hypothetical protein [Rugamonas sp. A1-17]